MTGRFHFTDGARDLPCTDVPVVCLGGPALRPSAHDRRWTSHFATVLATLNFLNLLPLWPLDGGRIVQVLVNHISPRATRTVAIIMSGLALVVALKLRSFLLIFAVATSVRDLFLSEELTALQHPMLRRTGVLAGLAYLATFAAFLTGAQDLLRMFL